jgi:hypothetical protein
MLLATPQADMKSVLLKHLIVRFVGVGPPTPQRLAPHRCAPSCRRPVLAISTGDLGLSQQKDASSASPFAEVLPSEGAGLSLTSGGFRVPLGASDDTSGAAERLQFTLGEGPCLQAMRDARELRANQDDIARLWPLLYDELVRQTPYRSIASVPLRITPTVVGAIDVYFTDPAGASLSTSVTPRRWQRR